jgi:predicted dinucleotide-binding enzyme
MKIGIVGSGEVGFQLAEGLVRHGHQVMLGSRDPNQDKIQNWSKSSGAQTGTLPETTSFGDLLILATAWSGTENAIQLAGPKNFAGKVLIDVTNPLAHGPSGPSLAIGHTDSGGEQVQRWLPDAKVVKCFSIVGSKLMIDPKLPGGPPDMFYCGNDEGAKRTVQDLLRSVGWGAIDLGGIESSRYLEPMAMAWIVHGFRTNTWNHAFKLLVG